MIKMKFLAIVVAMAAFVLSFSSTYAADDPIVTKMQSTYEALKSFDAHFVQVLRNPSSGEEEQRTGFLFFKKPSLVRWETETPEKELLVVGKKAVWDYFYEEKTAYKYKIETILDSKTMLRFVSGQARLSEDFWVTRDTPEKNAPKEIVKLVLTPKEPEPQLVRAFAWIHESTGLLHKVLLQDFYGNENELTFSDIKLNPEQPNDLFQFIPPNDAEIFDNTVTQ